MRPEMLPSQHPSKLSFHRVACMPPLSRNWQMLRLQVGLFSPIFVIGGLMGRIFGEIANWMDRYDRVNINFQV